MPAKLDDNTIRELERWFAAGCGVRETAIKTTFSISTVSKYRAVWKQKQEDQHGTDIR